MSRRAWYRMRLEGKVVLITGASEGIGAACAAEFAAAGARVSLTARSADGLARAGGASALLTAGDLTFDETRRRAVDSTIDRFGAIDVLVNNAGVGIYGPSWAGSLEDARWLMELNFFALLAMIQLVTPHMRARRSGAIVNVSSIAGKVPLPWMTVYSASKYAVTGLTEGLRMELRGTGVKTMLVCPGYVITGFQKNVRVGQPPAAVLRARRGAITAQECARAIRRGVERDARTVLAPPVGWALVAAARLFPRLVEARMAQMNGAA
jgi:short-subunit dehydrogenase